MLNQKFSFNPKASPRAFENVKNALRSLLAKMDAIGMFRGVITGHLRTAVG